MQGATYLAACNRKLVHNPANNSKQQKSRLRLRSCSHSTRKRKKPTEAEPTANTSRKTPRKNKKIKKEPEGRLLFVLIFVHISADKQAAGYSGGFL
jgi:hypothetical protein